MIGYICALRRIKTVRFTTAASWWATSAIKKDGINTVG